MPVRRISPDGCRRQARGNHYARRQVTEKKLGREDPSVELSRRALFKILGGGILLAAFEPDAWAAGWIQRGGGQPIPQQISAWVHVSTDGRISVFSGKAEVGQNVRTSLSQAAAEELRVPIGAV